ncbi:MAG TPA: adenylate/guanylate cyclase domain-containing protein [Actinomycetales bacterium]|nr:adenylate/guanylate cyclase domain-containing protein [Actinomycetales bacterium]
MPAAVRARKSGEPGPEAQALMEVEPPRAPAQRRPTQTAEEIGQIYLGEDPFLTMEELAEQAGTTLEMARDFWRSMGFANVPDGEVRFVQADVHALRGWAVVVDSGRIDTDTAMSLIRAQSYNMERLALWQLEAAVEDLMRRFQFDDTAARIIFLDRLSEAREFMVSQLSYTWRRQVVDLVDRTIAELAERGEAHQPNEILPLPRALGFVDMVAFTSKARQVGSRELVELVQGFEFTARDVISANGARVVKTVGDAVLYVADDLLTAARVALAMKSAISDNPKLLPVRASLVWGRVVSRSGDIFGPAVNLASRLIDIAPPETVYMDEGTAALLSKHPRAADFLQVRRPTVAVPGIGEITPIELKWSAQPSPEEIWVPTV